MNISGRKSKEMDFLPIGDSSVILIFFVCIFIEGLKYEHPYLKKTTLIVKKSLFG